MCGMGPSNYVLGLISSHCNPSPSKMSILADPAGSGRRAGSACPMLLVLGLLPVRLWALQFLDHIFGFTRLPTWLLICPLD